MNYENKIVKNKYVIFPIENKFIWSLYKKCIDNFWTVNEKFLINVEQNLTFNEMFYLKLISQSIILDYKFNVKLSKNSKLNEENFFHGQKMLLNNVHQELFSIINDKFYDDNLYLYFKNCLYLKRKKELIEEYNSIVFDEESNENYGKYIKLLIGYTCFYLFMFTSIELLKESIEINLKLEDNDIYHYITNVLNDNDMQLNYSFFLIKNLYNPDFRFVDEIVDKFLITEYEYLTNSIHCSILNFKNDYVLNLLDKKKDHFFNNCFL